MKTTMKSALEKVSMGALRMEMVLVMGVVGVCAAKAGMLFLF